MQSCSAIPNKAKFERRETDLDKSENEVDYKSVVDRRDRSSSRSEGEYDGEGESYSSSCSCSSCLREKNADNGMSLKLSQYSYRPTYGGFQKNETEEESQVINMSGFRDGDSSYYNNIEQSTNKGYTMSKNNQSIDDVERFDPKDVPSALDKSNPSFPDNLNNGKFKMDWGS